MEPYYYSKMSRPQQAAYHGMLQGLNQLAPEIQLPRLSAEELYDVFFRLRLDHPEIFWATGYKYRFYQDSPNLLFLPDYLFEKSKIREHQQAMRARIDKLIRPAKDLSEPEKEQYIHDFICENIRYDKLKKTVDKTKAKEYFEKIEGTKIIPPKVHVKVDNLLREFILGGGFEINLPDNNE